MPGAFPRSRPTLTSRVWSRTSPPPWAGATRSQVMARAGPTRRSRRLLRPPSVPGDQSPRAAPAPRAGGGAGGRPTSGGGTGRGGSGGGTRSRRAAAQRASRAARVGYGLATANAGVLEEAGLRLADLVGLTVPEQAQRIAEATVSATIEESQLDRAITRMLVEILDSRGDLAPADAARRFVEAYTFEIMLTEIGEVLRDSGRGEAWSRGVEQKIRESIHSTVQTYPLDGTAGPDRVGALIEETLEGAREVLARDPNDDDLPATSSRGQDPKTGDHRLRLGRDTGSDLLRDLARSPRPRNRAADADCARPGSPRGGRVPRGPDGAAYRVVPRPRPRSAGV